MWCHDFVGSEGGKVGRREVEHPSSPLGGDHGGGVHFEYHRPGKPTTIYREWLVVEQPDVKVLLLESYVGRDMDAGNKRMLDEGASIVWYVFPDAWYDIGRFHLRDGTFTGWYTNFSKPVQLGEKRWVGYDLFLDLWQPVDGDPLWLDEDEFDAAVKSGVIDTWTSRRVGRERAHVQRRLDLGTWPPKIARDVDLLEVQAVRNAIDQ